MNEVRQSMPGRAFLPFPKTMRVGRFLRRVKRFSVEASLGSLNVWVHSNNTGAMLGLLRRGSALLLSPACNPARKLAYTLEAVWLGDKPGAGFWVGVNTSTPNRMFAAAFKASALAFAKGYENCSGEVRLGQSRLDARLSGHGLAPLWVECKNVTLVEDQCAAFPDAASERACKHLRELMSLVERGERAAMFYLVQRPDARCFAPADFIDPQYAALFQEALGKRVEAYVYTANVSPRGIALGFPLALAPFTEGG